MSYGLVLGAGGAAAWVFHTGVIRTLQQDAGFDPTSAELIIGTSAGAAVAATLRAGRDVAEVFEAATRPPSPEQRSAMLAQLRAAPKTLRPLSPGLARHALPGGRGITLALAGLIPPGWFPTDWLASFPGMNLLAGWPDGLWIPATRAADGDVVVFGRDRRDVASRTRRLRRENLRLRSGRLRHRNRLRSVGGVRLSRSSFGNHARGHPIS